MQALRTKNVIDRRSFSGGRILLMFVLSCTIFLPTNAKADSIFEDVYRRSEREKLPEGSIAVGSGAFISPSAVLTSGHVIAGCRSFLVENPYVDELTTVRLGSLDRNRDAAVLLVDGANSRNFLGFADSGASSHLKIMGYTAAADAAGAPNVYRTKRLRTSVKGMVALSSNVPAGMSGGPVVDENGSVVAILTGRFSANGVGTVASSVSAFSNRILRYSRQWSSGSAEAAVVKIRCNR